jgi:hypothetical protein
MYHNTQQSPEIAEAGLAGDAEERWRRPLFDGFDGTDFSPDGGLYYKDNYEQSAGTIEFRPGAGRGGSGALKLAVRQIAPIVDFNHSERAEVWERTALRVPYGQGVWYGFAVKFVEPIPADDHRYVIAQWKREIDPGADGNFSPFLALRLKNGKLYATVETNYIAPADAWRHGGNAVPTFFRPHANQMRMLVATDPTWTAADASLFTGFTTAISVTDHGNPLPLASSGWIDFAIYAKPGPDGSGHVEIIANGKPVVTVKGPVGHADKGLGRHQYFKFGPYRAGHAGEWTLHYDYFRRSPNRDDVMR